MYMWIGGGNLTAMKIGARHGGRRVWQNLRLRLTAQKDMAHQLYYWVDQLEEEQRQAVHLHYYQGLSLSETAEVLGIATSTLKYRLKGALEFLRSKTAEPIRH